MVPVPRGVGVGGYAPATMGLGSRLGFGGELPFLGELVAPLRCVVCGTASEGDLCVPCARTLQPIADPKCERCGTPTPVAVTGCASCGPLGGFGRARSLLAYGGPATRLVLALKRRGRPGLAAAAGGVLADLARVECLEGEVVAFVPAGRTARRRGFDHAELLARAVARSAGRRCLPLLVRTRRGARQADVALEARRENVRGRFLARPVAGPVLLVDDVFTTGATAEACATALVEAGAPAVDVLTLARTIRRRGPVPGPWR